MKSILQFKKKKEIKSVDEISWLVISVLATLPK